MDIGSKNGKNGIRAGGYKMIEIIMLLPVIIIGIMAFTLAFGEISYHFNEMEVLTNPPKATRPLGQSQQQSPQPVPPPGEPIPEAKYTYVQNRRQRPPRPRPITPGHIPTPSEIMEQCGIKNNGKNNERDIQSELNSIRRKDDAIY